MQAVLETLTSKVVYLFEDGLNVIITPTQMTSPLKALDIKSGTHHVLEGISRPEYFFGGFQSYIGGVWEISNQPAFDDAREDFLTESRDGVCGLVKQAMYARLNQGIIYKYNNGADPYPLQIRPSMRSFLSDMNELRQRGRDDPHGGKIWQNNTEEGYIEFPLNDSGLDELVLFSGVWGHKISQIANVEDTAVKLMGAIQLAAYNPNAIDWTVTWDQADQNKGWTDNEMLQIPN